MFIFRGIVVAVHQQVDGRRAAWHNSLESFVAPLPQNTMKAMIKTIANSQTNDANRLQGIATRTRSKTLGTPSGNPITIPAKD